MKKLSIIITAVMSLLWHESNSQNLIAVQNGGAPAFFQQVDSAIVHSQNGDTIFIPGGRWNISKPINKRLHIIGVGHNPDSTNATFSTTLIGALYLSAGASHGTLTGVFLQGSINGTNDTIHFYSISRCRISSEIATYPLYTNFTFYENILEGNIRSHENIGGSATNCSFFNNIFSAYFGDYNQLIPYVNSVFKNNIFLKASTYHYSSGFEWSVASQYSLFENNIFLFTTLNFGKVSNSTAKNNLFTENISFPVGTNVGSNNIVNQSSGSIFINMDSPASEFSYNNDYHLQSTCPGKNAGTDGTDVGIYGGLYPWKDGSIPYNPHFQTFQVGSTTNPAGSLDVNIKVSAQDR